MTSDSDASLPDDAATMAAYQQAAAERSLAITQLIKERDRLRADLAERAREVSTAQERVRSLERDKRALKRRLERLTQRRTVRWALRLSALGARVRRG